MAPASVYIGGLSEAVTRSELNDHLSVYGKVTALNIHKGYTFVEFGSETDALDFVSAYANQPFMGTVCKIEVAKQPRRQSKAGSSTRTTRENAGTETRSPPGISRVRYPIVVYNLNPQTCWQELKDFGRRTGSTVAFCDIDKHNRRRGFLEYYTQEDADRAVKELDGQDLLGHRIALSSYVSVSSYAVDLPLRTEQGKKTLREEHAQYRLRSPTTNRDIHSQPCSPTTTRGPHLRRSRSPLEMSRHQNTTPRRSPYYSARRRGLQNDSPRRVQPESSDDEHPPRHDERHSRFAIPESEYSRRRSRSRSPTKARRATDLYDELSCVSDERRVRMDRIADQWSSYNRLTPPEF